VQYPIDYTYRKQWKTIRYTSHFLDIEGVSDSTSRDIRKASKWHGLGDTLVMDDLHAGWQKNYSHMQRRYFVGVSRQLLSTEGHFITTALLPGCR